MKDWMIVGLTVAGFVAVIWFAMFIGAICPMCPLFFLG